MRTICFSVALVLLCWAVPPAAAGAGELNLSQDFRIGDTEWIRDSSSTPGLQFEIRGYPEYNAVEWQVRLHAPVDGESPVCENLRSADWVTRFPSAATVTLHWSKGSHSETADFQPRVETLSVGKPFVLESFGGRSSDGAMPYFNLASDRGGLIVAVGWSGDWKASFEALSEGKVRITAGLKRSRFRLRAGEQVRLPSMLVLAYRGDWLEGQNRFRRLMLCHFTPQSHPPMELMPVAASVHGMIGFNDTTEANLTALARDIASLILPIDTYWLDAGWNEGGFARGQGNPQADPARFPQGLAPVGRAARDAGLRFLVWFEPERAMPGTWLEREHADWLLAPSDTPAELGYMERDGFRLLDLGDAQARAWALDAISKDIRDSGIAVYRQDFNLYPAFFWHTGESPDEIGLREVRYITGLYEFLDGLAARHPGLILDNCASGGRRLDFEMMRRCVVLWRSDSCWDAKSFPRNVQAMTYGLSLWLPLHGLGAAAPDDIALRSGMGACASFAINFRDPQAVAALRGHLDRYVKVRPLFAADYHPLTEWSDDPAQWLAFQFHDPQKGEGLVQAFSGSDAAERAFTFRLEALDPAQSYTLLDWDRPSSPMERSGADLAETGIEIRANAGGQQAIVLHYTPRGSSSRSR
ncbi:MAG: alpha-galactosidase [Phycisphaerae bacterium]|nr:alpha-galactosidase [Phycisphaerae bacterium]